MGAIEAFLAAAVTGLSLLLASVAFLSWRRADNRKMAVLGSAFFACAAGGALMLAGELVGGALADAGPVGLAAAVLVMLLLLYGALFSPRR